MSDSTMIAEEGMGRWSWFHGIWRTRRMKEEIDSHELVLPLMVTSFVTGALDSTCYADLSTFASNQTGNIILVSVGVADIAPPGHKSLFNGLSLAGYVVSALVAGHLGNFFGPRRRFWIMFSHATQVSLLVIGLVLLYTDVIGTRNVVLLLLLASASGVQVAQARTSKVPEVPTAMLSTPIVDLIVDPNLFKLSITDPSVQGRNRRASHIFFMFTGSVVGAFLRKAKGTTAVILLSIVIKSLVTGYFWLIPTAAEEAAWKERKALNLGRKAVINDHGGPVAQTEPVAP